MVTNIFVITVLVLIIKAAAQPQPRQNSRLDLLSISQSVSGTLQDASSDLWFGDNLGLTGGQRVYQLETPLDVSDIVLTTCLGPSFDGTVFLFNTNPIEDWDAAPLEYSRQDHHCDAGNGAVQTTMIYRLNSTSCMYYALIQAQSSTSSQEYQLKYTSQAIPFSAPFSWGLDRIDQKSLPLDGQYTLLDGAQGVYIYVLDTGIRTDHTEFNGRAMYGYNIVDDSEDASDCNGHGTHVAAIAAGSSVGVARAATIIAVKVLDCNNQGSVADLVKGIEWVINDIKTHHRRPALVTASIATAVVSQAYDEAVQKLNEEQIPFVGSAGNAETESCDSSPGSSVLISSAVSVGATNQRDQRHARSKSGPCTTIWAPGVDILSADYLGKYAYVTRTGTSQATPFVAGTLALLLGLNPKLTPEAARNTLIYISTPGVVQGLSADDRDRFLFVRKMPHVNMPSPPPKNFVYIYTVLRYSDIVCDSPNTMEQLRAELADIADLNISAVTILDCGPAPLDTLETTQRLWWTDPKQGVDGVDTFFQILVPERTAHLAFTKLNQVLSNETGALYEGVTTLPWVVDSNGYAYWDSPRFEKTQESSGLSIGAIAGIVVGCLACLIVVVCLTYFMVAKSKPGPEKRFEGMHGGEDPEVGDIEFHDDSSGSNKKLEQYSDRVPGGLFSPRGTKAMLVNDDVRNSISDIKSESSLLSPTASGAETPLVKVFSMGGEAFVQIIPGSHLHEKSQEPLQDLSMHSGMAATISMSSIDPEELLRNLDLGLKTPKTQSRPASPRKTLGSDSPRALLGAHLLVPLSPRGIRRARLQGGEIYPG